MKLCSNSNHIHYVRIFKQKESHYGIQDVKFDRKTVPVFIGLFFYKHDPGQNSPSLFTRMKFTAPVVAAISAGSLVVLSLIVGIILYVRGFFDSGKEPEKPSDLNHPVGPNLKVLKDNFFNAVDEVATHLNPTICEGLKSGTLNLYDDEEYQNWLRTSLKNMED